MNLIKTYADQNSRREIFIAVWAFFYFFKTEKFAVIAADFLIFNAAKFLFFRCVNQLSINNSSG